nr:hypothetical protein [Hymenobacter sp.]
MLGQLAEPKQSGDEMEHAQKAAGRLVIACGQAPELLESACELPLKAGQLKVEKGVIFSPSIQPYEKESIQRSKNRGHPFSSKVGKPWRTLCASTASARPRFTPTKYAGLQVNELMRLKRLEAEN